jgi:hypothetical protein
MELSLFQLNMPRQANERNIAWAAIEASAIRLRPSRATAIVIGPIAFFMKPFDDEKFVAAVRDALSQSEK